MDPKIEKVVMRLLKSGARPGPAEAGAPRARSRHAMLDRLLSQGRVTEEDLARCTAQLADLEFVPVEANLLAPELSRMVPASLAYRDQLIPIAVEGGRLQVAAIEPVSKSVIENLHRLSGRRVDQHITTRAAVTQGLRHLYGLRAPGPAPAEARRRATTGRVPVPPASQLLQNLLVDAMSQDASDIHLEPEKERLRVRFRVDGVLMEHAFYPREAVGTLVSRVKVLAHLDIAEKRAPQDGAFEFRHGSESLDVRVSVLPALHGEKVELRLLMPQGRAFELEDLGMEPDVRSRFEELITHPHGIILITGPTGSGKSTTLYAALKRIRSVSTNITTVEDPIEYHIDGVTQTQVDPVNKFTFATALRAILRQDPDIMMVGEIRDRATADMALRAALTGHLVFSTLHTNDAPGGITRLVDMGCEPFLVSSSVSGIVAQRLVRRVCEECREAFAPDQLIQRRLGVPDVRAERTWYRGLGCDQCLHTGYRGRTGVYELFELSDETRAMVVEHLPTDEIRRTAIRQGMRTLRGDSILKVDRGRTTPEEALRVTALD